MDHSERRETPLRLTLCRFLSSQKKAFIVKGDFSLGILGRDNVCFSNYRQSIKSNYFVRYSGEFYPDSRHLWGSAHGGSL